LDGRQAECAAACGGIMGFAEPTSCLSLAHQHRRRTWQACGDAARDRVRRDRISLRAERPPRFVASASDTIAACTPQPTKMTDVMRKPLHLTFCDAARECPVST